VVYDTRLPWSSLQGLEAHLPLLEELHACKNGWVCRARVWLDYGKGVGMVWWRVRHWDFLCVHGRNCEG
jgi:hypothetical protein